MIEIVKFTISIDRNNNSVKKYIQNQDVMMNGHSIVFTSDIGDGNYYSSTYLYQIDQLCN